jgi:hypothetical protein
VLILMVILVPATSQRVVASTDNLSIKLEEPRTPINKNDFSVTFVTLDTAKREVIVKCFKKGPSDDSFAQFGSDIALEPGGNTGNCLVNSSIVSSQGSYQFYAEAKASGDIAVSSTVVVEYKTQVPANPYNFSKDEVGTCEYKIKFKTANDGITEKVVVYMSSHTSFRADLGTSVGEIGIGSDKEGEIIINRPNCSTNYYVAIRAFDNAGNGSGLIGDSNTTTVWHEIVIQPNTFTTTGAISVSTFQVGGGRLLGNKEISFSASEEVLGSESEANIPIQADETKIETGSFSANNINLLILAIIVIAGIYFYRRSK